MFREDCGGAVMRKRKSKAYCHEVENHTAHPETKLSSIFTWKEVNSLFSDYILVTHQVFFIIHSTTVDWLLAMCQRMRCLQGTFPSLKIPRERERGQLCKKMRLQCDKNYSRGEWDYSIQETQLRLESVSWRLPGGCDYEAYFWRLSWPNRKGKSIFQVDKELVGQRAETAIQ